MVEFSKYVAKRTKRGLDHYYSELSKANKKKQCGTLAGSSRGDTIELSDDDEEVWKKKKKGGKDVVLPSSSSSEDVYVIKDVEFPYVVGGYTNVESEEVEDSFLASFLLGWGITVGAGVAAYPIDTVRRRRMMTLGEAVKYKSSPDAFSHIIKNEGAKFLFKGAGANILRAVAGAGVLAGHDKLQLIVLGKKY
ncbi:hypothetical protein IFM89_019619 [Coptis chinensis]|uniref:ADP/ATP translocase n=1 Tax=Coptis chinensis TaxID=261450 RepID=A0A835IDE0_9MAGN|nr:hypothetical protein IFM89_019619 [Coptis chinensis]